MSDQPAALLRQAAEKLRETAKHATPGPWSAEESTEYGFRVGTADQKAWVAWTGEYDDEPVESRADARWIALMSPALAGPLADWLESEASYWANVYVGQPMPPRDHLALAVARTILGKETR
jgi:hypothetical protein